MWRGTQVVSLPSKAVDVLIVLMQRPRETVTKDELMKTVWAETFVEEGNLTQTIFLLRKALGDSEGQTFIVTVPRQGYQLAADVKGVAIENSPQGDPALPPATPKPMGATIQWSWVTAAMLAVVAAVGWWYGLRASKPAPSPLMNLSVDLGPDALTGQGSTVTMSPDGTRIAFRSRVADGKSMLALRSLDQSSNRPGITLLPATVGANNPFFSPDGQWLAYWADKKLRRISIQGGASVTVCDSSDFGGGSWGANNQIVAILGSGSFRSLANRCHRRDAAAHCKTIGSQASSLAVAPGLAGGRSRDLHGK